jgi:ASC-1-like (ASCH) protein
VSVPVFFTKKGYFQAIKEGKKTVDVRRGRPLQGGTAVFLSGPHKLRMKIVGTETGKLADLIREDNFRLIVPWAGSLGDVLSVFNLLYFDVGGDFTAYYVAFFADSGKSEIVGGIS